MKNENLFCVGQSPARKDAEAKAVGDAKYIDDYVFGGMLHAAAVRSPRPHIKIKGINWAKSRQVPGFVDIVTSQDIPGVNGVPLVTHEYPFLPKDESKFYGETLAIVVAETPEAARRAAELAEVSYTELPFVDDPLKALEKDAPKVYGDDNIFSRFVVKRGSVEQAFAEADAVVEGTFSTNYHVHVYLETQGAIAVPESGGAMTVYGTMQCPFYVHDAIAQALGITQNMVRVVQTVTGGGFGGKEDVPSIVAGHAALAARKTGRPVKLIYDRCEDFRSMSKRHPSWARIKYGAKKDGTITACKVDYVLDGGAYCTLSPIVLWRGTVHAAGPYRVEHVDVRSFAAATNKVPCGAYRGFGQPQICFANESLIDELAGKLGMDPIELRLKNILRPGDKTITGQIINDSCGLEQALMAVKEKSNWDKRKKTRSDGAVKRALGVSINYYGVGLGARGEFYDKAGALVAVEKDGSVRVAVGNTEMGQGAQTVLSQICAETLNAPYGAVRLIEADSSKVPDSGPTVASRTTLMSGNAILDACKPIRERILSIARELLGPDVKAEGGVFSSDGKSATFKEVVAACWKKRLKMSEQGWYTAPHTSFRIEDGQGDAYAVYAFSADVADVSVDTETGEARVEELYAAHELGKAVNPQQVEGQVQGGALQAIGYALYENLQYKNGIMVNPNLTDYIIPSAMEMPKFHVTILEKAYSEGPFGAKGFGETPLIGPAAAVANAIKNAVGARVCRLPMLPETILEEMQTPGSSKPQGSLKI